jgi:hypothetical protein
MSFASDFVFLSGLDHTYDSRKRALVQRTFQRRATARTTATCGLAINSTTLSYRKGRIKRQCGEDTQESGRHVAGDQDFTEELAWYGSRCVGTIVDNVMAFDPFDSTSQRLQPQAQRLCRHCMYHSIILYGF